MRRKFHDAEPSWPQAKEMLVLIRDLYRVESEVRALVGEERRLRLGEFRHARSKANVATIGMWLACEPALPRSGLGKAISYATAHWDGLVRFLEDARIPLDTNLVERGTRVATLFYTLIESAKHLGVEPAGYLATATRRAIENPGTVTLPRQLSPD